TGVIAPGASLEIEVAFDATGLSADIYSAQILINSNDPVTPQVVVPVTLEVMSVNCSYVVTNDNENNALQGIPDGDLDNYLCHDDLLVPIEFNIFIDEPNIESAQLSLYAWDVDETGSAPIGGYPEVDEVYVNGNFIGTLTGADDEWSTSVFNIPAEYLNPGPNGKNLVQVHVSVLGMYWCVEIDWGQLIINNCMGGNAYIRYATLDNTMYPAGADVEVTVEVDTDLELQNVIIETNLLDENNINVAGTSTTRTIALVEDEPLTVTLALPPTATLGANYHAQVIVYDATTYVQQDLALVPFLIFDGQGLLNCLDPGWHLISSPYYPENAALDILFAEVNASGALVIMINKYGIYWPASNINMLGDWNSHHGYKIKMAEAACIIWDGDEVMDKTVNLDAGVDYLPVLSTGSVAASYIFDQLDGQLLYAFDIDNGLIYWPGGGIYNLLTLEPGKAYLVNLSAPGAVTYPFAKQSYQASPNQPQVINNAPYTVTKTGGAHFISIKADALTNFGNGDIVAAFNTQGTCVGMAQYNGDKQPMVLAVYADDFTTETIDGMNEGELMQLVVYSPAAFQQKVLQPVWNTSMTHTDLFAENALSEIIDFKDALGVNDAAIDQIRIYPNPSTGIFTVTGANESILLEILNTAGQQIQLLEVNGSVQIDLSGHAKGIYYLRMISQQSTRIQKIVVE
ncbi:MAG: T9SS type A sorting domain-containing protein, partial [Clostridia bacterium]|nr:T9SS type A sorting domain-containing protein [Clostridia bacterium]